jgi:hypothetical protein
MRWPVIFECDFSKERSRCWIYCSIHSSNFSVIPRDESMVSSIQQIFVSVTCFQDQKVANGRSRRGERWKLRRKEFTTTFSRLCMAKISWQPTHLKMSCQSRKHPRKGESNIDMGWFWSWNPWEMVVRINVQQNSFIWTDSSLPVIRKDPKPTAISASHQWFNAYHLNLLDVISEFRSLCISSLDLSSLCYISRSKSILSFK